MSSRNDGVPEDQAWLVGPAAEICSARGCPAVATYDLQWNNPRIHPPERRKHWLACDDHRDSLAAFLSARGMLREVSPR